MVFLRPRQVRTGRAGEKTEKPEKKEPEFTLHLDPFTVNLDDQDESHFLRVTMDLGLGQHPKGRRQQGRRGGLRACPSPSRRDTILTILSACKANELLTPEGKDALKQHLLAALQQKVPEMDVRRTCTSRSFWCSASHGRRSRQFPGPVEITESAWQEAGWLPCRVAADLAVRAFTLGDLLSLEAGSLVDTGISTEADISVRVNGVRVGQRQAGPGRGTPRRAPDRTALKKCFEKDSRPAMPGQKNCSRPATQDEQRS